MKPLSSIRVRITLLAAVIVAAVLLATAVAVIALLERELLSTVDHSLEQRADQIDATAGDGFANTSPEDRFAQLLDLDGEVLRATANVAGSGPLAPIPTGRQEFTTTDSLPIEDDGYRILSRRVDGPSGGVVLVVGENIDGLRDSVRALTSILAILGPLAVGLLALAVWWLVGRTLRPVEAIRAEVTDIGLGELDRRVPVASENDEIGRLAGTMNEMLDRLQASNEHQQRFVADASHELRTPLTRMRTELEVEQASDEPDFEATCESVLEETVRMQSLIDGLLFLARSDGAGTSGRHTEVDLDHIVDREVRHARSPAGPTIAMRDVGAATVIGDEPQLARLVANLLANAVRHAERSIRVGLRSDGGTVLLTIDDDGPGIPPADRERVLDRFTRLDDARTQDAGGSGLGLAICREIVLAHAGRIGFADSDLGGARVEVELPDGLNESAGNHIDRAYRCLTVTDTIPEPAVAPRARLKHRRGSRWMHWINFPLIAIMIWSGLRIYWANDVYRIGLGDWTLFSFFPEWFYERLDLDRHLARGMAFHFTFAWLFTLNGIAYALYTWRTGEWRFLAPDRRSLRESAHVLLHDLHLRRDAPPTNGRYNAAQRLSYTIIVLLGGLAVVTGFAIYKPTQLSPLTTALGGYETARAIHFGVTIAFLTFFVIHVVQVARAGWRNLWSMITGYELDEDEPPE